MKLNAKQKLQSKIFSTTSPKAEAVAAFSPRKTVHHIIRFHMGTATHSAIQCIPTWFEAGSSAKGKIAFQSYYTPASASGKKYIYICPGKGGIKGLPIHAYKCTKYESVLLYYTVRKNK